MPPTPPPPPSSVGRGRQRSSPCGGATARCRRRRRRPILRASSAPCARWTRAPTSSAPSRASTGWPSLGPVGFGKGRGPAVARAGPVRARHGRRPRGRQPVRARAAVPAARRSSSASGSTPPGRRRRCGRRCHRPARPYRLLSPPTPSAAAPSRPGRALGSRTRDRRRRPPPVAFRGLRGHVRAQCGSPPYHHRRLQLACAPPTRVARARCIVDPRRAKLRPRGDRSSVAQRALVERTPPTTARHVVNCSASGSASSRRRAVRTCTPEIPSRARSDGGTSQCTVRANTDDMPFVQGGIWQSWSRALRSPTNRPP